MDDARIRELTQDVLTHLRDEPAALATHLEARVAALEGAVRQLQGATVGAPGVPTMAADDAVTTTVVTRVPAPAAPAAHPALRVLDLGPEPERCLMEPHKPCSGSGGCRTFGY